jgi:hypothetical protein
VRFNKTLLNEFYRVAFRKRLNRGLADLQEEDLDSSVEECNTQRPHQGRWCFGKAPMQTFVYSLELAKEKCNAWRRTRRPHQQGRRAQRAGITDCQSAS